MPAPKVNSSFAQVATASRTKVRVLTCLTTLRGISAPAASICHSFRFRGGFIISVTSRTLLLRLRTFGFQTGFGISKILTRLPKNSLWLPRAAFFLGWATDPSETFDFLGPFEPLTRPRLPFRSFRMDARRDVCKAGVRASSQGKKFHGQKRQLKSLNV